MSRRRPAPPVTLPGDTDGLRDEVTRLRTLVAEMRGSYFVVDDPTGPYVKSAVGMSVWERWSRVAGDGSEGETVP
jgi:hypothetical protein